MMCQEWCLQVLDCAVREELSTGGTIDAVKRVPVLTPQNFYGRGFSLATLQRTHMHIVETTDERNEREAAEAYAARLELKAA